MEDKMPRTAEQLAEDKALMMNQNEWTHQFLLPLRRSVAGKSWPECGFLTNEIGQKFRIWLGNIFDVAEKGYWDDLPYIEYGSFDAILGDGWYVD
jgi:hypothetical protein